MGKSYIKQAEENLVNQAVAFNDFLNIIESLSRFGNRACKERIGREKFFEGLSLMRQAIYAEYAHSTSQLLMFSGIGGEKAQDFARKKFKELFGKERFVVMHFLEKWGHQPGWYKATEEEEFRAEAKDIIDAKI